jgi:hypothetical protein
MPELRRVSELMNPRHVGGEEESPPAGFTCDAVTFDGTNDYLARGANLTGIADSPQGTVSMWLEPSDINFLLANNAPANIGSPCFVVGDTAGGGGIDFVLSDAASSGFLIFGNASALPSSGYFHVLASWKVDAASGARRAALYIQDVSDIAVEADIGGSFSVDYESATDFFVGSVNGSNLYSGNMAEVWFDTVSIVEADNTISEVNRRKFISATGKPVDLGADGSTPTGTSPLVYLHIDDGETANNFSLNAGSGGDFTVNGALAMAASSPSD